MYPTSIQRLLSYLNKLPGVGPRTAERFAFRLLLWEKQDLQDFGNAIYSLKDGLRTCHACFNFSERDLCRICQDRSRNSTLLCVVAEAREVTTIEQTGAYDGQYFVLGGNLDTMRGVTPEKLHITELIARIQNSATKPDEIILGFSPNLEGETTMLYLKKILASFNIKVTKLARGLPTGSDLEYADAQTVSEALRGRKEME